MAAKTILLVFVVFGLLGPRVLGAANQDSAPVRSFNKLVALTNTPIEVSVNFTNSGTNILRGFYYAEQVPSCLAVSTLSVSLNGFSLTNFNFESGRDGDVYSNCTPWRWRLETPTNFLEANSLSPQSYVQILYSLSSSNTGMFNLEQFSWAACLQDQTNTAFGDSQVADQQTISFVESFTAFPPYISSIGVSNQTVWITWSASPGYTYRLESRDVMGEGVWQNLTGDLNAIGPTLTVNVPLGPPSGRFYRVCLVLPY